MKKEIYEQQAMTNLHIISRTANGIVDTSASPTKNDVMAVTDSSASDLAVRNYKDAIDWAWKNRYKVFRDPKELRSFIQNLAKIVNRDLVKDGVLFRSGADSTKYDYTPIADIETSASWFYDHLFSLLCEKNYDAVKAAATVEYYINITIHIFADGCGKCATVAAAWLLMRGNRKLPEYPDRDKYYSFCHQFKHHPAGSDQDLENAESFHQYYEGLLEEDTDKTEYTDDLTILLPDKIFMGNVERTEAQIRSILDTIHFDTLKLDARELEYISSVGLRLLMRLNKEYEDLTIFNVQEPVYEILDISGFTSIMRVDRRLKQISIEGCELIGKGMNGSIYRYSQDTVVKMYTEKNNLEDIRRENQMSRFCFISGLPTVIPLNLVQVGDRFGAMYELLDARPLCNELVTEKEQRESLVEKYITLMKDIHEIVPHVDILPKGIKLPREKEIFLGWAMKLEGYLDQEAVSKLCRIIEDIPERNTLLHGDLHPANLMDVHGELILIDLDGMSTGDPVFDLANIAAVLDGFPGLLHDDALRWGDADLRKWVLEKVLDGYYSELKDKEREEKKRLIMLCMHTRVAQYAVRHENVREADRKEELERLYEQINAYH